jgi:hypothetical protein
MNDNPLQMCPIEIAECSKLKVINFSNSYIKYMPREMYNLKFIYLINLDNCDLQGKIKQAY